MKNDKITKVNKNSSSKNKNEDILEIRRIIDDKEINSIYYLSKNNKKGKNSNAKKTEKGTVKTKKRIRFGKRKVESKDEKKLHSKTEKKDEQEKLYVKKPFLSFKPTKKVPKEGEDKFKTPEPSKDERSILFGKRKKELSIEDKKPVLEQEAEKKLPDEQIEKQEIKFETEKIKEPKDKKHLLFGKTRKENKTEYPMQHFQKTEQITINKDTEISDINKLKASAIKKLGLTNKETWEELDFYPLIEPFAYALIIRKTDTLDNLYIVVELELNKEDAANYELIQEVLGKFTIDTTELESKGKDKYLKEKIDQIIEDYTIKIDTKSKREITYFLEKELLGLGKLEPLMKDPNIEDISCDNSEVPIFIYHRYFGSLMSSVKFTDEDELSDLVVKLSQKCGKHISIANPMLDATMPDGSRIQMTLSSEITTKGSTFTIRKFKENPFSPSDLIEFNTMSSEMMAYLWLAVEHGANALIAGGTASGKTSTLNALALYIPPESKIVTIEETREINLPHSNWIPGVARSGFGEVVGGKLTGEIDMYDLMKAALRQRPEYILVGEIRGRESYVLFQAMATGHTTYSTVHADSTKSLIHRLEGEPINIPRIMLQSLDIVCIQTISRVKNKRARRCKQVIEIIDIDPSTKEILTNEVFSWDPVNDKFIYSGKSYVLERIRIQKDLSREEITDELRRRANLMEWMTDNNIKEFKKVASMVANYIDNPSKIMMKIKG